MKMCIKKKKEVCCWGKWVMYQSFSPRSKLDFQTESFLDTFYGAYVLLKLNQERQEEWAHCEASG